ncbi:MAG TPA: MaoC family dehydratase [Xanthobacteraceae bacterium]|nr:MaoC family dehydratase [Xanthobacteraceae bacterium]
MPKFYWEDFVSGSTEEYGPRVVSREEIIAFASEFDPQPMHLDEDAARTSMLGGLAASGWHSCAIMMRMMCDWFVLDSASWGGPGVEEVKWLKPIRAGDSLTLRRTVLEKRVSNSRPEMGFVKFHYVFLNHSGEQVMTLTTVMMMGRRAAVPDSVKQGHEAHAP